MAEFIQGATNLVEVTLEEEFGHGEHLTIVRPEPSAVLDAYNIKLYAQSYSGIKTVNMMSPALRRAFKQLAQLGPGHDTVINGVKWKFISRMLSFSIPMSSV